MPTVYAQGQAIPCDRGANLRQTLIKAGVALHNDQAQLINCRGIGSCGTCAVEIQGEVSPANWRDRTRRSLPPHDSARPLRLACQTQVWGDCQVTKYDGFWGQGQSVRWSPETAAPGDQP